MDYEKSIELIEKNIFSLIEENKTVPIVVEGEKDIKALNKLGINGEIIPINMGKTLIDFCDFIASKYDEIIILTDWDRKGGFLFRTIYRNLQGRVKCNYHYREIFAKNSTIKTVEGLPSWINKIKDKISVK